MAIADHGSNRAPRAQVRDRFYRWKVRLLGSRHFQKQAARLPIASRIARRDGEALFDLVAGFAHSQVLYAFVALGVGDALRDTPRDLATLSRQLGVPLPRMKVLAQAAAALGLMKRHSDERFGLGRLGAALNGVPGLPQMILHHDVLYRDLADPVAFFRDGSDTELAGFWPYVFGAGAASDPETAARYSRLMSDSQSLVAEEALAHLDLSGSKMLLDIGGGTGAFLAAVGAAYPDLRLRLLDLPAVVPPAEARFEALGLSNRVQITAGSFVDDPFPGPVDTISLVRVLYDHSDDTVRALLRKAHDSLPVGGRLLVIEPMTGGTRPNRPGDAYFGLYCMAMQTGRARSAEEISELLIASGFAQTRQIRTHRPFVTGIVDARKL